MMKASLNKLLKMFKKSNNGYLFLFPSLFGTGIFILLPFLDSVRRSFFEAMSGKYVGVNNFNIVLQNNAFKLAVKNTMKFLFICIPLLLALSLVLSFLVMNLKKHGEIIKTMYLIPMSIPVASVVLVWKVLFSSKGIINKWLMMIGLSSLNWLDSKESFLVLMFTYIWKNCGYDMVLWIAGLSGIDTAIYEAAAMDGCSKFQQFIYVTLPNLKITLFTVTTLSIINSFKVFREAYLIAGDYPNESIYILQHLFNNWFVSLDVQKMCAAAVMMTIFVLATVLLLQVACEKE